MTTISPTHASVSSAGRYMLPAGYVSRPRAVSLDTEASTGPYWTPERIENAGRYQVHVYRWAAAIARERGVRRVLDAGCGVATKLCSLLDAPGRELWGVDQASAVEIARSVSPAARYWTADLERPAGASGDPGGLFDLVVCADVLEHLENPDPLMAMIGERLAPTGLAVLSTPERDRLRGRGCRVSLKPDHVREWSRSEFTAYVRSRCFEVLGSRLSAQDETPTSACLWRECAFRLRLRERSPLACQAVLCRPNWQGRSRG
jgi:SAM-dependent methyltransferase